MKSITWKNEGSYGPVYLTDTEVTDLGWHSKAWAIKYAHSIGAKFIEA